MSDSLVVARIVYLIAFIDMKPQDRVHFIPVLLIGQHRAPELPGVPDLPPWCIWQTALSVAGPDLFQNDVRTVSEVSLKKKKEKEKKVHHKKGN